jgi:hypothetical protein
MLALDHAPVKEKLLEAHEDGAKCCPAWQPSFSPRLALQKKLSHPGMNTNDRDLQSQKMVLTGTFFDPCKSVLSVVRV